ncbi:MAG: hypothetical protein AAB074_17205 [Planctomycetota bacterium]
MRLQAFHCPSCAGSLDIKPGAGRVKCSYCGNTLVVEDNAVSSSPREWTRHEDADKPEYPEPGATLYTREAARFEMSVIEQKIPEGSPDRFAHVELGEERFALVYLRNVDDKGKPVSSDLDRPFETLKASLETDGDPGLAANCALEDLCSRGYAHRLEVAVLLFEPRQMTMTSYNAGCRDAIWWVSNEEGRCCTTGSSHEPLERKFLRETRDHFENGRPVHLAAGDLFVMVSSGFAGRGGSGMWPTGLGTLTDTLNDHLGEEPLRVVTLVKNEFWAKRSRHRDGGEHPCGDVKIAAVRAILPPEATAIPGDGKIEVVKSRKYEIGLVKGPRDIAKVFPLHSDRQVLVWMSPREGSLEPADFDRGAKAILEVLDGQTGDNDNPRAAGRDAYEAMKTGPGQIRMAVIQCLDQYGRVKYFRAGWKQPVALGPRGIKSDGMQQFDEGGEATVNQGARLFFPGPLEYEGEHHMAEYFAQAWEGGKASRLYEAMREHWKTKSTVKALEKLAKAAASDVNVPSLVGMALVTGVG